MWKRALILFFILFVTGAAGSRYLRADHDEGRNKGEEEEHHERRERRSLYQSARMPAPTNAKWKTECSGCHMLYPPGLLPQRSWTKIMSGLEHHFGENASLDPPSKEEVTRFLLENSADRSGNRRSEKINRSIAPGETPIRITETPYFVRKHDEIGASVWKRPKIKSPANCIACHKGAEEGRFSEHEVSIPK